ncbi:E3 ubiquitin-protein ligase CHFR [Clupea harengus]|uniref:E3 ubiquitin-protein ligase CHFR n=1 Tax=Clupea harengus TaxID=7950 RepID=A0A6P3VGC7_CLUHA|nr:E3 ubiquitin-protein ligase CHFR [Clupea harengus]
METQSRSQPWGKLINLDRSCESEVLLVNRECTIGRRKGCDLSFPANKLVSGDHCKIVQDERSGKVWLEDMSTNGTVINMSKLVKKQMHHLQNGDVIYFVYRKNEPEQNIAYIFQSMRPPHQAPSQNDSGRSAEPRQEKSAESTPEPPTVAVTPLSPAPQQPVQEEPQPSTSSSTSHLYCHSPSVPSGPQGTTGTVQNPHGIGDTAHLEVGGAESSSPSSSQTPAAGLLYAAGPHARPLTLREMLRTHEASPGSVREGESVEPERKKRKIATDGGDESSLPPSVCSELAALPKQPLVELAGKERAEGAKTDKMEESLTCIICQDLLHDCVSLQPCMHTFCAACYSGWMERSSLCPTCRCPVERIRKNHILNNLVEAYLQQHPEKCRSEEDLQSMDMRNKITQDMLQPKIERSFSDEEGSSDYLFELSDNDSDTSDMSQPFLTCRQCPGYRKDMSQASWIAGPPPDEGPGKPPGEGPSTSAEASPATALQEFKCPPQGSHVICTCCLQPMPDRRGELSGQQVSSQQCMVCQRPFCHMYWGCQRIGCHGCLARFSELNLTDKCLDGVLNSNNYESEILQNYLSSRGMSWKEMLQEGLQAAQRGVFHLSDFRINTSSVVCYCCGLRAFKELAYKFRESIPSSELPATVTSRPDCYWGRNCRTQVKAHHATKFNHICEQTRFKN